MKGYKAFDKDLKCRGVQYEVGYTFYEDCDEIIPCKSGIHFCEKLNDVYKYYPKSYTTRVCEVECVGNDYKKDGDKIACREIKIIRELSKDEIGRFTDGLKFNTGNGNTGSWNTGYRNTGNGNTGSWNTGYRNTGHCNTGDRNTGDRNTGNLNTGDLNTGSYNTGYRNTGSYNTGGCNTGNCNTGDRSTGIFNTKSSLFFFNKSVETTKINLTRMSRLNEILARVWPVRLRYIYESNMTDQEKLDNPNYKTTGGYLKKN